MINVGSEKGFYFSNPRDYLDGKINDINSIAYSAYTIDRSESIYRKEVSGWGVTGFTFYDCDSGISMTKDEFAKIITENFADFDYPFFVQKMKPSLTWRNENSVFSIEDLDLYEQLLKNQSDDKSYIVDTFREKARKISKSDLPAYLVLNVKFFPDTYAFYSEDEGERETLFENIERKFNNAGYEMPKVTFWNLQARTRNIPGIGDKFNYISGFSMSQMETVMAGLTATEMMLRVLLADRYKDIAVE